ncbi:dihydroxybiphenyl dioxygenase domain-containing protein [Phlyctochytrium arcticum]|nr:dihydroxybiphenyl dioxygenase domain-containing protein [Phlyctochytrium arcticum]KAI9101882.1 dihydroxybiphenyl dioxygenase domain-containing protein [Phlyctochytrium arcticum]
MSSTNAFHTLLETEAPPFLNRILSNLHKTGLPSSPIDHICYRVETEDQYIAHRSHLLELGHCLVEAPINGRLIATFKLRPEYAVRVSDPVTKEPVVVDVVELPMPKVGQPIAKGFEHVEVVVKQPLEEFMAGHESKGITWDLGGFRKEINRDVRIEFERGPISVKFHEDSLENVIAFELAEEAKKAAAS